MNEHEILLNSIPTGKDNAVSMKSLAEMIGVSERRVRSMVNAARADNFLISSGNSGYWRPETNAEVKESYIRQKHMATSILRTTGESRRVLGTIDGQISLDLDEDNDLDADDDLDEDKTDET